MYDDGSGLCGCDGGGGGACGMYYGLPVSSVYVKVYVYDDDNGVCGCDGGGGGIYCGSIGVQSVCVCVTEM